MELLQIDGLSVSYASRAGHIPAVQEASLCLAAGETLAVVGETGCGKTSLALAVGRLLPNYAQVSGRVMYKGEDLLRMKEEPLRQLRRGGIHYVFQDPAASLDPMMRVGAHLTEVLGGGAAARLRAQELLCLCGLAAKDVYRAWPHQLSGGMQQRVGLALALANGPKLLVADEPTTALDTLAQAQVLRLLQALAQQEHCALLLITHDLGVAAELADRIAVMQAGRIVEEAPPARLFAHPRHAATRALLENYPPLPWRAEGGVPHA